MYGRACVNVVIPALNEAEALPRVLAAIPEWVDQVVVGDNGSTDATAEAAAAGGALVVSEPRRGYGRACLAALAAMGPCEVVVFLDADFSDDPARMADLVAPIVADRADMVLGSRVVDAAAGSLTATQRFGNALSCRLMQLLWRHRYTDLGPFRAIRAVSLRRLGMADTNYGWTVEMQIKAVRAGLRIAETPTPYRVRIGQSKVSGTLGGIIGAGSKILWTITRYALAPRPAAPSDRLIVFGRFPTPGRTKTRLIGELGAIGAAECQRRMTEHIVRAVRAAADPARTQLEFAYEGGAAAGIRRWVGRRFRAHPQGTGDVGERMARCFDRAFADRCDRVVLIGTDCPGATAEILREAFDALATHDLVVGPAVDGGYYLIGMRRPADVFSGIEWSTSTVLAETLDRATDQGMTVHRLATLRDMDRPEDLIDLPADCRVSRPYLSVIIPALNEAERVAEAIRSARAEGVEVIVVDGGSTDATVRIARAAGAEVIRSARGRAVQMNAGAATARADVLLFLHADTVLPTSYLAEVLAAMCDRQAVGGAFRFGTDYDRPAMRLIRPSICICRTAIRPCSSADESSNRWRVSPWRRWARIFSSSVASGKSDI